MLRYARDVAKKFPFAFGVGVAAAKTSAADYLAQTVVEGKKQNGGGGLALSFASPKFRSLLLSRT